MTNAIDTGVALKADPSAAKRKALHKTAVQLEGMFTRQLFSAMRSTVPTEGVADGGAGEEMFTSVMDEHIADSMPSKWQHGFTDKMVSQLENRPGTALTPDHK